SFVADGFERPEAKGSLTWVDRDTVFVGTDLGPGSTTRSGYPRTVRRWTRGTALADAPEVFAGQAEDLLVAASHDPTPGFERDLVRRGLAFYASETYLLTDDGPLRLVLPTSARAGLHREWLTVELRHDWQVGDTLHRGGSLLVLPLADFLVGDRGFHA